MMSVNETLLIIAAILVLVDFFVPTDVPTHLAYVLVSVVIGRQIDAHVLYMVLLGMASWFGLVAFHYTVWRNVVATFANRVVAPDRYKSGIDAMVGRIGKIQGEAEPRMILVDGDLWECTCVSRASEGAMGKVTEVRDGVLVVQPLNQEEK
jgi:membrane protein implicated in regulation of membrane protease activity